MTPGVPGIILETLMLSQVTNVFRAGHSMTLEKLKGIVNCSRHLAITHQVNKGIFNVLCNYERDSISKRLLSFGYFL